MAVEKGIATPGIAEAIGRSTGLFVRQSSGLVRVGSATDVFLYNFGTFSPFIAVAIGIFWVGSAWPGANLTIAILGALVLAAPVWATFALLSAAMPRTAAQYVTVSRILNPAIGFMADFGFTVSSIISIGLGASWVVTVALSPALTNAGILLNNSTLVSWGANLNSRWGIIIVGAIAVVAVGSLLILGTRRAFAALKWTFWIGLIGVLPFLWVLITKSHQDFVNSFNAFGSSLTHSSNSYQTVLDSASKQGLSIPAGHPWSSTLPAIVVPFGLIVWAYWSSTIAGEMRGAGSRKRQLTTMMGGGFAMFVVLFLLVTLSLRLFGEAFLSSAVFLGTAANNPLAGVTPYVYFFGGVLANNVILQIMLAVGLTAWLYPNLLTNFGQATRSLFAYSLDRVMPTKLSDVNDRTHSPVVTISICMALGISGAVWVALSTTFLTAVAFVQEMAVAQIFLVGLTGMLFPWLKKDVYTKSQADVSFLGIPVITIAGAGCVIAASFYMIVTLSNSAFFGLSSPWLGIVGTLVPWAAGLLIFAFASYMYRRRGFRITATYAAIPPE
jgi:APA family basic amino acid/polyamine antiporter